MFYLFLIVSLVVLATFFVFLLNFSELSSFGGLGGDRCEHCGFSLGLTGNENCLWCDYCDPEPEHSDAR